MNSQPLLPLQQLNMDLIGKIWVMENTQDTNEIALLGRALSSPIRIEVLRLINKKPYLLSQLANKLDIQLSSMAVHMKILEEAKLVTVEYSAKKKARLKWYTYAPAKFLVVQTRDLYNSNDLDESTVIPIAIGDYIDAEFDEYCGFASETECLMNHARHDAFCADRHKAQILWNRNSGFVTYGIPNTYAQKDGLFDISFSLEICSETSGYNNSFPSDITFWINEKELYTWTCPGDFGDQYGKYTPSWWFPESTKYGLLVNLSVRNNGVYFNESLVNKQISLADLQLDKGQKTTFKVGVKQNAYHCGGFNLFGEKFGNYAQSIVFTALHRRSPLN